MIDFENIRVGFNVGTAMENLALRGVDLKIHEGDFVTVIGSNGAGKSTLLNTLTGDVSPLSGRVKVDGVDITGWSTAQRAGLSARVFQDPMLGTCANLTIEENLALAHRRGMRRNFSKALNPAIREEFREHISILGMGLENRLSDPIGLLSGGQRQTISLLMAVSSPMKILVLDEHTAALDPKMAAFVIDLTAKIVKERNLTVLMVTHSMQQALHVGNRTIMLHQGKVMFDISGKERECLDVPGLLDMFKKSTGGNQIDDDKLILS